MDQLVLDAPLRALARATDPDTSREAAARVDAPTIADRVVAELERGDGTSHELAARLGLNLVTVSPRMRPLLLKGRVAIAGKRDGRTVWRRGSVA